MAVYVIVALVAVAVLVAAYRVLGGAAARVGDPQALLLDVLTTAQAASREFESTMRAAASAGREPSAADALRSARRRLESCAQQLERLDVASLPATLAEVRALAAEAIDELSWAVRLCASERVAQSDGMRRAIDDLRIDAARDLDAASAALGAVSAAEERNGPG